MFLHDPENNIVEIYADIHPRENVAKILAITLLAFGLGVCTSTEKTATGGVLIGAGAGALIYGGKGAVAGALIGGVAATLIGKTLDGCCIFHDRKTGRAYRASC